MSVLHLLAPGAIGGSERVVEMLASAQRAHGFDVRVATVLTERKSAAVEAYLDALRSADVPVYCLRVGGRAYADERRRLQRLLAELGPQVVHTHGYRADVVDAGVARGVGAALVSTAHGFTGGSVRNRCYEWVQRRSLRRFDAVVAVSHPMQSTLARAGIDRRRLHVIINGWKPSAPLLHRRDARAVLGLADRPFVVGWVGRVSREKGLDVAVRALPLLADLDLVLAVVGDGPERPSVEAAARKLGVARRVHWCGVVPQAAAAFPAFDALLCSSRTEGTPVVLLEAMDAGVPIVATAVGGIPDLLGENTALLTEPDNPEALAAALRDVCLRPASAQRRSATARCRLQRNGDVHRWVRAYDDVYRAAMRAARMRP